MNLLFATLAAALVAALCGCGEVLGTAHCRKVKKNEAKHLLTELKAIPVDNTPCGGSVDKCTECYTSKAAKGSGYIEYFADCGEAKDLVVSEDDKKKWTCNTIAACTSISGKECYPVRTILSTASETIPSAVKHCKHAVTSPEIGKTVAENKDTNVVCHDGDECAFGVGYEGEKKYAHMGCMSGCQALIDGKKTEKNGKADATCKACTDADTCSNLEKKPAIPKIDPSKKDDTPNKKDPKKDGSNSRASFTAVSAAASTAVLAFLYAGSK